MARFRKTKGEFTTFIKKNNKFKPLGPLHGDFRDLTRIENTKKTVWEDRSNSSFHKTDRYSSDLNLSVRSSISKNSELITEKHRIRQNRERVYKNYQRSLEKRKE